MPLLRPQMKSQVGALPQLLPRRNPLNQTLLSKSELALRSCWSSASAAPAAASIALKLTPCDQLAGTAAAHERCDSPLRKQRGQAARRQRGAAAAAIGRIRWPPICHGLPRARSCVERNDRRCMQVLPVSCFFFLLVFVLQNMTYALQISERWAQHRGLD